MADLYPFALLGSPLTNKLSSSTLVMNLQLKNISKPFRLLSSIISILSVAMNVRRRSPSTRSYMTCIHQLRILPYTDSVTLDLGCGSSPKNPFSASKVFGIDVIENKLNKDVLCVDLSLSPIPFNESYFDFCTAFDFLEHVPKLSWLDGKPRYSFIELMNEVHRVLKPGGYFLHSTPSFPSLEVFQDPTHINIITENTFKNYFCEPNLWATTHGYGFHGNFRLLKQNWLDNHKLVSLLQVVK